MPPQTPSVLMSAGLGSNALRNSRKPAGITGLNSHPDPPRVILYWTPSVPPVRMPRSLLPGCSPPGQIPFDSTSTVEPSIPTLATVAIEDRPTTSTLLPTGDPFFNAGETISYARHSGNPIENGTPVTGFTSLSERTCSLGHASANAGALKTAGTPTSTQRTATRANIRLRTLINFLLFFSTVNGYATPDRTKKSKLPRTSAQPSDKSRTAATLVLPQAAHDPLPLGSQPPRVRLTSTLMNTTTTTTLAHHRRVLDQPKTLQARQQLGHLTLIGDTRKISNTTIAHTSVLTNHAQHPQRAIRDPHRHTRQRITTHQRRHRRHRRR